MRFDVPPGRPDANGRLKRCRRSATLLVALLAAGCEPGIMDPRGPIGSAERTLLIDSLAIMLSIVVPTIVATLGVAWWFRATNRRARYQPEFSHSGQIELVVWGIPLLTVMLLAGVAWVSSHDLDPAKPLNSPNPPLDIQVVSLDWKWLFIYPAQHVASVNELVVPAGRPLHLSLTSASVLNTFFVPQLGSMIYTMNGMAVQLNLQADQPGVYRGLSAHYSGDGFSDMHFATRAVAGDKFLAWVAATQAANGPTLDAGTYGELEKQSVDVAPFTYRSADPAIFDKIVSQQIAPAPGPSGGETSFPSRHSEN